MADTVKKSRIVSENECFGNFDTLTQEDTSLQDIINEEFTQRLKNCMSDEPPDIIDNHEEIGQSSHVLKNGSKPDDLNNTHSNTNLENDNTDDQNSVLNNSNINLNNGHTENIKFIDTQKFIDTEIETEIKNNVILSDDLKNSQVIIPDVMISSEPDDEINEEVTAEVVSPVKEEIPEVQEIEDDGFVNKEVPSPETDELDEITPPYDNITVTDVDSEGLTAKERFLSTVTDLDDSNVEVDCISNASSTGSNKAATVKDRMFLSTNSACLLFTQTVVQSPMLTPNLTPTEENYDFLQSPTKEETKDAGKVDILVEKGESFLEQLREETPQNEEIIKPENLEIIGREESVEMSEISAENSENDNSEHFRQIEDIKEDIQMFVKEQILDKKSSEEEIIEPPIPSKRNIIHDQIDINNEGDGDGDDDKRPNVSKVSEISKIFTSSEQNELNTSSATKISPIALQEYPSDFETIKKTKELFEQISKSPENIVSDNMKKSNNINASENDTCSEDDTNDFDCNDSTTVTSESTFVETRTESNSGGEKILKKKKSKKSKKDSEKENISVSDVNNINNENEEENLSHVSVKTLCRSFSDLTTISTKNKFENLNTRQNYGRAKSMSDIRRADSNLENVFTNVSVKYLRECFDNLTNMTTNKNNCLQNKLNITKSDVKPVLKTSDRIEKLKSSFSKFDALSKKTVLHVRSSDAGKAQEKFNGTAQIDTTNCKACQKQVFQMEQIKAEKAIWHKNCFRCKECNKQLNVDTYQSNEGVVYCKPHFKALFTPKAVEDEPQPIRPRKHELIIRENQPLELPPDVVRASDKPDLGLEELQNLNVKERFQVFEHHENSENSLERTPSTVNVKRSPSILSKLAKFQQKGMDIGVGDDSLNGVPVEESSSEAEDDEDEIDGTEDPNLIRARRAAAQREIPLHFNNMSEVMSKWESGNQMTKEERREERKQEIQSIRSRLFMGKQGKMKELYQQAVAESESGLNVKKSVQVDTDMCEGAKSLKDKFERGESLTQDEQLKLRELEEDKSVFESGISKKSRSIFLELDANASKPPQLTPLSPSKSGTEVRRAREAFMAKQASEDVIRASDQLDDVVVKTADISNKFKFFESYKEQEKPRKQFRITPPRDGQLKMPSPDRDVYRDPDIVRSDEQLEDDSLLPKKTHTATKMLNIFRQMEENLTKKDEQLGPKPLKRFTPPPEGEIRREESGSEEEVSESEEENEDDEVDHEGQKIVDDDLIEAQKAARAKHLRAKFEKWEANEIQREQNNSSVNLAQEIGEGDSQIESAKSLRARFESMRDTNTDKDRQPRVKVNRFVDTTNNVEICKSCKGRVYPLEKISCHNSVYHKNCFKCRECNAILRMDSYSYNQGLLYCLPHFKRLFAMKGNYESGFGLDQHKEKWNIIT